MPPLRIRSRHRSPALALLMPALWLLGCAHGGEPPPEDATEDPEFQEALRGAKPDFELQSDALEAGLYEAFVPPESLPPMPAAVSPPAVSNLAEGAARADTTSGAGRTPSGALPSRVEEDRVSAGDPAGDPYAGEDPSTEELLRTLPDRALPDRAAPDRAAPDRAAPDRPVSDRAAPDRSVPDHDSAAAAGPFTLQLGAFGAEAAALARAAEARARAPGWPVEVAPSGGLVRVYLGRFTTEEEAEMERARLAAFGLGEVWVTRRPRP